MSERKAETFNKLALAIFTKHPPKDPAVRQSSCHKCGAAAKDWDARCADCGTHFPACTISGKVSCARDLHT